VVNIKRVKTLKKGRPANGPVLYWMSRDQRVNDNWALAYAIELAENIDQPVMVVFNLVDSFLGATWRQYDFMIRGLKKTEQQLADLNISFSVLIGEPAVTIPGYIKSNQISHLVMDFDPIKIKREWQDKVASLVETSVDLVDAHNIVPCFAASDKEEFSAATFRPKITRLLSEFMDGYPPLVKQRQPMKGKRIQWEAILIALKINHAVRPVEYLVPGEKGARAVFEKFIQHGISDYAAKRNDPNENHVSGLSPYLHFGHISAQRIALDILLHHPKDENTDAFLEELIVRRELADNFCYYNPRYGSIDGFKPWALRSLEEHLGDKREFLYNASQFEQAETHDTLWNAAQTELLQNGKMHGYIRMYWAKKILEWSDNPETALKTAVYLNDKYQLDGRDPNGYAGCAWSIGGIHDRAWADRDIFGKIRYMNRAGCERKFDVGRYINKILLR
jgi:deoxyribodipyrimidine photo-lyase